MESSNLDWLSWIRSPLTSILNSESSILNPPTSILHLFFLNPSQNYELFYHRYQLFPGLSSLWSSINAWIKYGDCFNKVKSKIISYFLTFNTIVLLNPISGGAPEMTSHWGTKILLPGLSVSLASTWQPSLTSIAS